MSEENYRARVHAIKRELVVSLGLTGLSRAYGELWQRKYTLSCCPQERAEAPSKRQVMESKIHIGQVIKAQLKADQRSVGWLSREIGCTRNHVYKIFNKPSLDSELVFRISQAMHFNFFQYYTAAFLEALKSRTGEE